MRGGRRRPRGGMGAGDAAELVWGSEALGGGGGDRQRAASRRDEGQALSRQRAKPRQGSSGRGVAVSPFSIAAGTARPQSAPAAKRRRPISMSRAVDRGIDGGAAAGAGSESRGVGAASVGDGQSSDGEDDEVEDELLARARTRVVGLRYYSGTVSNNEAVMLVRQPSNPYDRNAIQCLNLRGVQIGHIAREDASRLAPLLDNASLGLRLEGTVPSGANNVYAMPLSLNMWGPVGNDRARNCARHNMRYLSGYSVPSSEDSIAAESQTRGPTASEIVESGLAELLKSKLHYKDMPEAEEPPGLKTKLLEFQRKGLYWMCARERRTTVDEALAQLTEENAVRVRRAKAEAKEARAAAKAAAKAASKKRKRQAASNGRDEGGAGAGTGGAGSAGAAAKKGVAARKPAKPPQHAFFWKKKGAQYVNVVANFRQSECPVLPRGGILADEMGMGKSVQLIATILASRAAGCVLGPTLIVCPLSVLSVWQQQFSMHVEPETLTVAVHHGAERFGARKIPADADVVLTTYGTLTADVRQRRQLLTRTEWGRVVLDEAHIVRSQRTARAKAVNLLEADVRWCLTGTPIVNKVEDVYSAIAFLRLSPFDDHAWFNRTVMRPIRKGEVEGLERLSGIMSLFCLRRTKDQKIDGKPLLRLPERDFVVRRVPLLPKDRALYERLFKLGQQRMDKLSDSDVLQNYASVLLLLLRLRQLCCHGDLVPDDVEAAVSQLFTSVKDASGDVSGLSEGLVKRMIDVVKAGLELECCICLDDVVEGTVTSCAHLFCLRCIKGHIAAQTRGGVDPTCPLCRDSIDESKLYPANDVLKQAEEDGAGAAGDDAGGADEEDGRSAEESAAKMAVPESAKLNALVQELRENIGNEDSPPRGSGKTIVFSQFTSLLDLTGTKLRHEGIPFTRIDGSLSLARREAAVDAFQNDPDVKVLLMSLTAGNTGLTLTAASNVALLDVWWSPSAEDQAIARAHRLGQQHMVRVTRIVAEDTLEDRILELQDRKRLVAASALGKRLSADELRRVRLDNARMLMSD